MIDQRPDEVATRNTFGHWEADTVVSRESKAALMVVQERKSRLTLIRKLIRKTAKEMCKAVNRCLAQKPESMKKIITFDNGAENAEHEKISECLNVDTYFCNPYHSWKKGSVENAIGLIRAYLPKKTDFKKISVDEIKLIEHLLNTRPRKCLGFKTPLEVYREAVALTP